MFARGTKRTRSGSGAGRMVFAVCPACQAEVRVWDMSRSVAPSVRATDAPLTAVTDADRRWECPQCGFFQTLPASGAYVFFDRTVRAVIYVGRSVDVQRRIDWWERPGNAYDDQSRYRGVQLVTSEEGPFPDALWFAAREAWD